MGKDFGVTFLGLWWAEFHAEKEMGAKMMGLPGSAVPYHSSREVMLIQQCQKQSPSHHQCLFVGWDVEIIPSHGG